MSVTTTAGRSRSHDFAQLVDVSDRGDDVDRAVGGEQLAHAFAHQEAVLSEHDPYRHHVDRSSSAPELHPPLDGVTAPDDTIRRGASVPGVGCAPQRGPLVPDVS